MKEKTFCKKCGRKIDTTLFIGEPFQEFEDGVYCSTCAKLEIDRRRKKW